MRKGWRSPHVKQSTISMVVSGALCVNVKVNANCAIMIVQAWLRCSLAIIVRHRERVHAL